MNMFSLYANKSNAKRAAKAAGLDMDLLHFEFFTGTQQGDGWGWMVVSTDVPPLVAAPAVEPATPAAAAPAPAAAPANADGTPKHKDFSVYGRSQVLSPVQFVKQFLDGKGKELTRKQALYELAQHGVNYATARTQYQRWFTANK